MSPVIIIGIVAGIAIVFEGLLIAYFASQARDQQRYAERMAARASTLDAEGAESKKQEQQLRAALEWFHTLFNKTNDMVFTFAVTEDGMPDRIIEVNDATCAQLGRAREDLLQMTPMDIEYAEMPVASMGYSKSDLVTLSDSYVKDQYAKIATRAARRYVEQIIQSGHVLDERFYQDKNGAPIPVEVIAQRFNVGGRTLVMCTAKDITERRKAEAALRDSKQRFQDFFASSPVGIAIFSGKRELIEVNQSCLRMFGIPDHDEFVRFNLFDNPFLSNDARKKLSVGESVRDEWAVDFSQAIKESLFVTNKSGLAYFDMILNNMGLDREYKPRGYFALVQDISERRKIEGELKKTEAQLRQAEKMEAIGSMAGGIAHDFNNILTPIVGYAKMLVRISTEDTPAQKYAQGIQKASIRAKDLVAQILTFSRKADDVDQQILKPIRVIPIAKEVLQLQRRTLPPEIEINRMIKTERDVVVADPIKIHQVVMNLTTNAWHAMRDKGGPGTLEVILTDFLIEPRGKNTEFPQLKPGRYLRISIRDTGTGIPPHVQKRMFEPFFTTKKVGEGTGMGLAVVHGVVTGMHGGVSVDTEVGKGTTFHIVLPTVDEKVVEQTDEATTEIPLGNECILVVDDEPDVAEVIAHMLESLGYKPIVSHSGDEALHLFKQSPNQFDMAIIDQVMPGLSGIDVTVKMLEIRKNIPIILCYAYAEEITLEEAKAAGARNLLDKPILLETMAAMVRSLLDEKKASAASTS